MIEVGATAWSTPAAGSTKHQHQHQHGPGSVVQWPRGPLIESERAYSIDSDELTARREPMSKLRMGPSRTKCQGVHHALFSALAVKLMSDDSRTSYFLAET